MNVAEAVTALRNALVGAGVSSFRIHIDDPADMAALQKNLAADSAVVVEGFHLGVRYQVTVAGVPFSGPLPMSGETMF